MSTAEDTQGVVKNGEEKNNLGISFTELSPNSSCSSIRCILKGESPDLDNPDLYSCSVCQKGFLHRSMNLQQGELNFTLSQIY